MNIFIKKPKSKRFIPKHSHMCYNKIVWNVYDSVNKKNVHNNHITINSGMDAINECNKLNRIEDNKNM